VKKRLDSAPANLDGLLTQLAERASKVKSYLRWINVSRGTDVVLVTRSRPRLFSKYRALP
jgi:hypothetical protein